MFGLYSSHFNAAMKNDFKLGVSATFVRARHYMILSLDLPAHSINRKTFALFVSHLDVLVEYTNARRIKDNIANDIDVIRAQGRLASIRVMVQNYCCSATVNFEKL